MPDLTVGRVIAGRYEILSLIGRGGAASVWRAYDPALQREVAVKELLMPAHLAAEEQQRSMREARTAARVQHPGAIPIYDIVTDVEQVLIVMELVRAPTLTDRVAEVGALPPEFVAALGIQLVDTLEAAHQLGIVHRDVKPANVMVTDDGRTCLTDFGVAMLVDSTGRARDGITGGTPGYMSPEQASRGPVGTQSDVFSLGATLFFAAEARGPFDRADWREAVRAVVEEPPAVPRKAGPLAPLLHRMLFKDPGRRPSHDDVRRSLFVVLAQGMPGLLAGAGPSWDRGPTPPRLPLRGSGDEPQRPRDAAAPIVPPRLPLRSSRPDQGPRD
ncbi:MAG: serine/threonine protein kinase [Streptosporangiales bacterium]|nr:serine/threonine protein kinase [Streptosporangiales bacterium]MBO0892186.1 serine/threonine protein kinase [Acidothermales bacterium]